MKKIFLSILCALVSVAAFAQGPNSSGNYYQSANGKKGQALKTAMYNIINPHTNIGYDGLWTAYAKTDKRADGKLRDWYSNATNFVIGGEAEGHSYKKEGDGYNREHSVPQSWFSKAAPMKSDVVHVLPTDGYVNNRRGSYPFGEVSSPTYSSANGYSKLGPCKTSGYTGTVFEPNDEIKGDIARIYFYMATCYEDRITNWSGGVITGTAYQPYAQWHFDMLMRWSKQDPVDEIEIARNNAVWEVQNNRNPFVDYPGLEDYIWGEKMSESFSYDNYSGAIVYTISTPVITPASGTYEDPQTVTITCATNGATIYYTTDGSFPTKSSTVYTAPFVVSENTVIQAKAYNGDEQSTTAMVTINIGTSGGGGDVTVGEGTFKLITSADELEAGKRYLLVGKNSGTLKAYNGAGSSKGESVTVTATNDVIDLNVSGNSAVPLVLGGSTNNWTLYDTAGAFYLAGVNSNGLAFEQETTSATTQWTVQSINASSGETKLKNNGYTMYLQFNTGSNIFRCYSSGQKDIYFYKEQETPSNVPTPTFSPEAGSYNEAQTVTISCTDADAAIYYTLDGTNPTNQSTLYSAPITIEESCYLKAVAVKGDESSKIAVGEYVILMDDDDEEPTLQFKKVNTVTPGKRYMIVYNVDGTLKAQNPETGTYTYSYLRANTVVTDNQGIITPDDDSDAFTFETATGGFYIKDKNGKYYYQSGSYNNFNNQTSVPTSGGIWSATADANGLFTITNTTTNKWIQYRTSQYNSSGAYSTQQSDGILPYLFEEVEGGTPAVQTVANPVFTPAAGTYDAVQTVTISCATEGAKIYYTTNLSTPTIASTLYSGPITVSETTTIKAIAVKEGWESSSVVSALYTIDIPITYTSVPQFTPPAGTYSTPQSVTISCNSLGAKIYYTTDGSEPTENSTLYAGETIAVNSTMTIKAFAVEDGSEPSFVVTAAYIINDGSSVGTGKFRRITSADELESGKNYLIVYDASEDNPTTAEVFNGVTSGNIGDHVSVAVSDLTIDNSVDGGHVIVLEKSGESWTMKDGDVYLAYTSPATTKNNYLWAVSDATADGTLWTISFSGVDAKIENDFNTTRTLYYNSQNPRFACYIASSAQAAIQLYKEIESQTETVVVGETEYASMYYGTENLIVPDGVNCSTYKINQNGELVESWVYEPGDVIPAGTGVIVKATTQNYQFVVTSETGDVDNENMLRGSDVDEETTGGAAYFRLSLNAAEEAGSIGFYYGAANGGAFTNMAHKAYLAVPSSLVGKLKASGYPFHDTSTGITGIDNDTTNKNEAIYTLDGRRVVSTSLPKGIYIRNGKKFIVK